MEMCALQNASKPNRITRDIQKQTLFMISKYRNNTDEFRPDVFQINPNWNIRKRINENVKQNTQFTKQGIGNFNVDILVDFLTTQTFRGA